MDFNAILENHGNEGDVSTSNFRHPRRVKNSILGSSSAGVNIDQFNSGMKSSMAQVGIPSSFDTGNLKGELGSISKDLHHSKCGNHQAGLERQNDFGQTLRNEYFDSNPNNCAEDQAYLANKDRSETKECGQGREHLKRKAKAVKNSKYDESSYLVDYSGNHNKRRKMNEDGAYFSSLSRSGTSSGGKILDTSCAGKKSKKSLKTSKK